MNKSKKFPWFVILSLCAWCPINVFRMTTTSTNWLQQIQDIVASIGNLCPLRPLHCLTNISSFLYLWKRALFLSTLTLVPEKKIIHVLSWLLRHVSKLNYIFDWMARPVTLNSNVATYCQWKLRLLFAQNLLYE